MSNDRRGPPEGWFLTTLEGVSRRILSGATPLRSEGDRYFARDGHFWVKTTDLNNSYIIETEELITDTAIKETSCRIFPIGTVLVAMYGGFNQIGRTGVLKEPAAINQALSGLILKDEILPEYVNAWLIHRRNDWRDFAASSRKDPNITRNDVCRFPILVPPLSEQRRISSILSQWDDSLSVLSRLIDAKRQQKRGLAEQLLTGKRRLPGFEEDWSAHPLGFLLLSKLKVRAGGADYPILSVTVDGVKLQGDHFNKRIASENVSDYLVVERGEIAMSGLNFWMGAVGMQSIVDTGVISPAYKVFKVNGQLMNSDYAMHFVRSETMLSILLESSVQGASVVRRNLDMKALTSAPVRLPSLLEQQAIATVLSTLDSEISALEAIKAKVAEQKRGLMDALLTGRVRVNVEEPS